MHGNQNPETKEAKCNSALINLCLHHFILWLKTLIIKLHVAEIGYLEASCIRFTSVSVCLAPSVNEMIYI